MSSRIPFSVLTAIVLSGSIAFGGAIGIMSAPAVAPPSAAAGRVAPQSAVANVRLPSGATNYKAEAPPFTPSAAAAVPQRQGVGARSITLGTAGPCPQHADEADLRSHNCYINVEGRTVHSPSATWTGSIPIGATALCSDGTGSFSEHHIGTCSYHGGVARWISTLADNTSPINVSRPPNLTGYGQISNITALPKTVLVNGYFRSNGTYVRPHYRSHR
jgi:hypothetical protein